MTKTAIFSTALLSLTVLFTGCTSMTSQQVPHNIQQQLNTQQPIISYFSAEPNEQDCGCPSAIDRTYSLVPVADGYYRKLLGRDKEGRFLVQDFYQKTNQAQSSPIWIKDPMGLFSFENRYVSGPVTLYFPSGKVSYKATLDEGEEVGLSQSFYQNGKLGLESQTSEEQLQEKLWYSSGAKAAELVIKNDDANQVTQGPVWDQQGQLVEDQQQRSQIIEGIYNQLNEDIN